MALSLAEGLVDTLKNYIEGNLPAKLNTLDGAYGDSIELRDTVATYAGVKSLKSIQSYPVLYIISPNQRFRARSTSGGHSNPSVAIGVVETDQDSEMLQRRLYRYGRALLELLLDAAPGSLNNWLLATDEEWEIDTISAEFSESGESNFVGEVTLSVRASSWEEK